jgi:hypothetical protein
MSTKAIVALAVLLIGGALLAVPTSWAQNNPPPPDGAPCAELCSAALSRQLSDDEKKALATCLAEKKCALRKPADNVLKNPLIGPF